MDTELLKDDLTSEVLYPFQVVGALYAAAAKRTFIADEMGLGKTRQAAAAVELANAYPCVVVCPPNLRGNWVRELRTIFPHRTAEFVTGNTPYPVSSDFIVVGYSVVKAWAEELALRSLVLDESHYCKDPKAQRTQACKALAAELPDDGLCLLLTGTPILNRPIELLAQLDIMGRLEEIAPAWGGRKADAAFRFKWMYCRNEDAKARTGHYSWDAAVNTAELHDRLRSTCYVRRERASVLPELTDTKRVTTLLSLNGELAAYRRAENDLRSFLLEHKDEYAVDNALRAEALVMLTTLLHLAGEAKVPAAVEYVNNWLESNPGRQLVVFAKHISVQKALVKAFNCPSILGGEADPEAQKVIFNSGASRVIVCSIAAAREGHTLVAEGRCSDVLFVEQGWNPGTQQQAEDRINRIGRTADDVFANYLLAEDTLDIWLRELIMVKQRTFNALVKGIENEDSIDESAQMEILKQFTA